MWRGTRARIVAVEGGRDREAEQLARESVELTFQTDCVNMQADALIDLAETLTLLGRAGESSEILERAVELYDKKGNVVSAAAARKLLALAQPVEVDSRGAE